MIHSGVNVLSSSFATFSLLRQSQSVNYSFYAKDSGHVPFSPLEGGVEKGEGADCLDGTEADLKFRACEQGQLFFWGFGL